MTRQAKSNPPNILVSTWVHNLMKSEDRLVKIHAKNMLLSTFNDMQEVAQYVKNNNISVG